MDTQRKLELLADASRFDLACACGTKGNADHRRRGVDGMWLYPVSLPSGGTSVMLKTLLSNACVNDCRYCPFRSESNVPRCTLAPEEVARVFMDYVRGRHVFGLFLSSGVAGSPDATMERLVTVADILRRRHRYHGYIHLKVIPGASPAAVEAAVALASAVSLNIEVPRRSVFSQLSQTKDFDRDIVAPIRAISRLTGPGTLRANVKQTTQFLVGAGTEADVDIVKATFRLYRRLGLNRVYYSAYQRGMGASDLPGERFSLAQQAGDDLFTREHRLYQVDFLLRKYGWREEDVCFGADGNLSTECDPKEMWARLHPAFFPVRLFSAEREALLRVPGLGPVTVGRILAARRHSTQWDLTALGVRGKRLSKVRRYAVPW
ncbi:MAG: radical SAM protein [Lentisphaerae bacterium]|nr:radical SAM protein [Lentisphaerota bacterium]MBT5609463.1 radical SAM protein [Lentisphaerota bacterium]MBT7061216.1 radical SAM protein [Lentisphaerota bacterium]MBT7848675.1 radical SAM protein [Lentisphaerota bacterium]